jgi:RHS repeat-associated protein
MASASTDIASQLTSKGFIGARNDAGALLYLHARYYAWSGTFITPDPSPDPTAPGVGLNRYAYAGDNPISNLDPSGLAHDIGPDGTSAAGIASDVGGTTTSDPRTTQIAQVMAAPGTVALPPGMQTPQQQQLQKDYTTVANQIGDLLEKNARLAARAMLDLLDGKIPGYNNEEEDKKTTIDESKSKHIFRDAPGHMKDDNEDNRKELEDTANDKDAQLGKDQYGNDWAAKLREDGKQTWTQSRNGKIINGGVNDIPRSFNPRSGLSGQ